MKFKVGDRVRVVGDSRLSGEMGVVDATGTRTAYVCLDNGESLCFIADYLVAVEMPRHRVYIWGDEKTAEVFQMTVDALFGYSPERTGSALVMSPADYSLVCDKTYATHAAIVAEVCRKTPDSGAL